MTNRIIERARKIARRNRVDPPFLTEASEALPLAVLLSLIGIAGYVFLFSVWQP